MKYLTFVLALSTVTLFAIASAQQPTAQDEAQRRRHQIHIEVQQICPVSGEKLGEHGAPIETKIGDEAVFLCCKGCLEGKVNPDHWATIHANFAKSQRICPVMNKELPKNPKWTIVEGQIVYVCCPPCTKKVAAAPERFLKQIDELYAASVNARRDSE